MIGWILVAQLCNAAPAGVADCRDVNTWGPYATLQECHAASKALLPSWRPGAWQRLMCEEGRRS
jgi:hypothetical protein